MATGGSHTTTAGTYPYIDLAPREAYSRPAAEITDDWTDIRGGVLCTLVGAGGGGEDPTAEAITRNNYRDDFCFGLSNGVGHPGEPDSRFIGLQICNNYAAYSSFSVVNSSGWFPFGGSSSQYIRAVAWNGSTRITPAGGGQNLGSANWGTGLTPQGTTNCAFWLPFQITLSGANATTRLGLPVGVFDTALSERQMLNRLVNASFLTQTGSLSAGWWSTTTPIPVGLRYPYIRHPAYNNRLRVFGWKFMQLA